MSPPLPPGAKLDRKLPPLPPGATLDEPAAAAPPAPVVETPAPASAEPAWLGAVRERLTPDVSAQGKAGAALQGFGQGASFGFVDELAGLVKGGAAGLSRLGLEAQKTDTGRALLGRLIPGLGNLPPGAVDALIEKSGQAASQDVLGQALPQGVGDAARSGYVSGRGEARSFDDAAARARPVAHGLGTLAGALAMPVGGAAGAGTRGAKLLGGAVYLGPKSLALAKTGAAAGALTGLGASEADLVDQNAASRAGGGGRLAADAATGGAMGAVLGPLAGKLTDKASAALKRWASENAARAGGLAPGISNRAQKAGLHTADDVRQYGSDLLDMGAVKFGDDPEAVLRRGLEAQPGYGAMIEDAIGQADATGAQPRLVAAAQRIREELQRGASTAAKSEMGPAMGFADLVEQEGLQGAGTFAAANKLKSDLYKKIPNAFSSPDPALRLDQQKQAVGVLNRGLRSEVERAAGPEVADQLATGNKRWGTIETLKDLAGDRAGRDMAPNRLGRVVSAGLGAGIGGLLGGGAAGGAGGAMAGVGLGSALGGYLAPRIPSMAATTQRAFSPVVNAPGLVNPLTRYLTEKASASTASEDPEQEKATRAFLSGS